MQTLAEPIPVGNPIIGPRSIVAVSSPRWASADQASDIFLTTQLDDNSVHSFRASQNDPMPYGAQLWTNAKGGQYGAIAAYDANYHPFYKAVPAVITLPAITGTPTVGQQLVVSNGAWAGPITPAFTYQWLRDGAGIAGATAASYTLVAADQTHMISANVIATNVNGTATTTSASVGPVS
jgi:hypothetical protein